MSSVSLHFLITRAVLAVLVDISRVNAFTFWSAVPCKKQAVITGLGGSRVH